ncbi:F-box protein At5g07610-like [Malus sylvestris]|uniref:F-box protein At5g07610-like n=1 Tax=Malus sylvestris TaxID=3752 RepID=UPI0021AC6FC3|nr:F-box protein At5g07610-like [Malus sylvestris]
MSVMDRGRRANKLVANINSILYMDLKDIIRNHALQFLPAKSLFRFTGVCRDWKLDITTPFFAHKQSNSFHDISGFFCQSGTAPPSFISLDPNAYGVPDPPLNFLPEPVEIRTSSNGLLCCQGRDGYKAYYICNPVTRKWKKLPKPNADHGCNPAIVLIFEPSLLNFVAEYKLVCVFPSVDFDNGYEFEIYSSRDESWRVSGEIYFGNHPPVPRTGVHVNDIVYWVLDYQILVFDLAMERAQLSGSFCETGGIGALGRMDGKLCLAKPSLTGLTVKVLSNAYTNTMGMHSNVKAWETKHQISLSPPPFDSTTYNHRMMTNYILFAGGNVVLYRSGGKLHTHDLKTKETQCLGDELDQNARIVSHVNSLVEI